MRGGGDEVNQKKKEGQRFRRSNFVAIPSKDDSRFFLISVVFMYFVITDIFKRLLLADINSKKRSVGRCPQHHCDLVLPVAIIRYDFH
jgi:hypothetical protein